MLSDTAVLILVVFGAWAVALLVLIIWLERRQAEVDPERDEDWREGVPDRWRLP